eukprot:11164336-Lingulodinium_polyedra.AAC.1
MRCGSRPASGSEVIAGKCTAPFGFHRARESRPAAARGRLPPRKRIAPAAGAPPPGAAPALAEL